MTSVNIQKDKEKAKFHLDIEGVIKDWDQDTITTEQVIALGGQVQKSV